MQQFKVVITTSQGTNLLNLYLCLRNEKLVGCTYLIFPFPIGMWTAAAVKQRSILIGMLEMFALRSFFFCVLHRMRQRKAGLILYCFSLMF